MRVRGDLHPSVRGIFWQTLPLLFILHEFGPLRRANVFQLISDFQFYKLSAIHSRLEGFLKWDAFLGYSFRHVPFS